MTNDTSLLLTAKRNRSAAVLRLEKALFKWVYAQKNRAVALNGELVVMQAQKLLSLANEHRPDDQKLTVQFSNGWMERFKKRRGLRFRNVHGEGNSEDAKAIRD